MDEITIRRPDDFHVHLRGGGMLRAVLPHTASQCGRALVMPNNPAVCTADDVRRYRDEILTARGYPNDFTPLMTVQITEEMTVDALRQAKEAGAIAAKIYPRGATTASEHGVKSCEVIEPLLKEMETLDMVLCLHGEMPDAHPLDREHKFLPILQRIRHRFPKLRIVLEHITTAEAVHIVSIHHRMAATITPHHLLITLGDVMGGKLKPHLFCKPIAKRPEDREALRLAATSGNPKFFAGTDSAPWYRSDKECAECGAGVFCAPVAMLTYAEVFETAACRDWVKLLENFTSRFGPEFYGLPLNEGTITLRREDWQVPDEIDGIVPFRAGETLPWQVV